MDNTRKQKIIKLSTLLAAISVLITILTIISVVALSGASQAFDNRIYERLLALRTPAFNIFFRVIATAGGHVIVLSAAALVFEIIPKTRHKFGFMAGLATGVGVIANVILKSFFQRDRPYDQVINGVGTSFPSNHAVASAAFFATIVIFLIYNIKDKRILFPAVTLCVLAPLVVSFCRVYLGAHWPTDTFAGMTLGAIMALIIYFFVWPQFKKLAGMLVAECPKLDIFYRILFGRREEKCEEEGKQTD